MKSKVVQRPRLLQDACSTPGPERMSIVVSNFSTVASWVNHTHRNLLIDYYFFYSHVYHIVSQQLVIILQTGCCSKYSYKAHSSHEVVVLGVDDLGGHQHLCPFPIGWERDINIYNIIIYHLCPLSDVCSMYAQCQILWVDCWSLDSICVSVQETSNSFPLNPLSRIAWLREPHPAQTST